MAPHWKAPVGMAGSLVVGCLLAVGHHLYYASLDGNPVSTNPALAIGTWSGIPSQKFHIAVGTAFASLVRTFLVVALATAYVQMLWRTLKTGSRKVTIVDAISGVLDAPWAFLNFAVWRRHPLLLCAAAVSWLIPIASIITPATLSVDVAPKTSSQRHNVPIVNFTNGNFASVPENANGFCEWEYTGPQFPVTQVVAAVVAEGSILPMAAPGENPNASYAVMFNGPALQCSDVPGPKRDSIFANVKASTSAQSTSVGFTSYGYLSWTPSLSSFLPFVGSTNNKTYYLQPETLGPYQDAESSWSVMGPEAGQYSASNSPSTLYVASFPEMRNAYAEESGGFSGNNSEATILSCSLVNSTYEVSFNWTNGIRTVNVSVGPAINTVTPTGAITCDWEQTTSAANLTALAEALAYQSVMDAFNRIFVGSISSEQDILGGLKISSTSIMSTVLGNAPELSFLRTYADSSNSYGGRLVQSNRNISEYVLSTSSLGLRASLELLFQNVTLSLMSSPLLLNEASAADAPPPTSVTFIHYNSLYAYSSLTLWLAYGIAIVLTVIPVSIGFVEIFASGTAYSYAFSTVLRTTSHAHTTVPITSQDAVGQDPLPKHLKNARIMFEDVLPEGDPRKSTHIGSSEQSEASAANSRLLHSRPR